MQDHSAARLPANRKKNRYQNVLAIEHSRVVLRNGKNTDYINANFIDGYKGARNAYIATQGPMTGTVSDFWQMVWEQNSRAIIMATKLKEAGRIKCDKYWPEPGSTKVYGNIEVYNDAQANHGDFMQRDLLVREVNGSEKRMVTQFQFTAWPEHNVPTTATPMLKLLAAVKEKVVDGDAAGPTVVHCSAGVGRTGTFILVDIAMQQLVDVGKTDLLKIVAAMRQQRTGMVQTQVRTCLQQRQGSCAAGVDGVVSRPFA